MELPAVEWVCSADAVVWTGRRYAGRGRGSGEDRPPHVAGGRLAGETDLDLGHYERFTNSPLTRDSNYTTGQIYLSVIEKERHGEFLGKTVQVIPHITNEIKNVVKRLVDDDTDVVITEIGGTVGDIESQPFLEAIRQFSQDGEKGDKKVF